MSPRGAHRLAEWKRVQAGHEGAVLPPRLDRGRRPRAKRHSTFPQQRWSTTALQNASDKYCVPNSGHVVECGGAPPLWGSGVMAEGAKDVETGAANKKQRFSNHRFPENPSSTQGAQGHFFFGIAIAEAA